MVRPAAISGAFAHDERGAVAVIFALALDHFGNSAERVDLVEHLKYERSVGVVAAAADDDSDWHVRKTSSVTRILPFAKQQKSAYFARPDGRGFRYISIAYMR